MTQALSPHAPLPPPEMSAATKEMLARVRQMVPPMLEKFHKGTVCFLCSLSVCL